MSWNSINLKKLCYVKNIKCFKQTFTTNDELSYKTTFEITNVSLYINRFYYHYGFEIMISQFICKLESTKTTKHIITKHIKTLKCSLYNAYFMIYNYINFTGSGKKTFTLMFF